MTKSYYKGAAGIVLVYDVTDRLSFDNVHYWLKKIKKHADPNVEIMLLGNKTDLFNNIVVPTEDGKKLALGYGIDIFETCAKDSTNIDRAFKFLLHKVISNSNLEEKILYDKGKNLTGHFKLDEQGYKNVNNKNGKCC